MGFNVKAVIYFGVDSDDEFQDKIDALGSAADEIFGTVSTPDDDITYLIAGAPFNGPDDVEEFFKGEIENKGRVVVLIPKPKSEVGG